jgi:acetyltransferase
LNLKLARDMMADTRVFRLLEGYRGVPAADIDGVAFTLVKMSQMVCDLAEIAEIDINPLLTDPRGVVALDARIRVARSARSAEGRMAIQPYPKHLERPVRLADGRGLLLRPIRPEDEPAYVGLYRSLSPEQIRMRFLHPMKGLSHGLAARLTQIDYDREMAFVVEEKAASGPSELCGSVRLAADPSGEKAEFAIVVRSDRTGLGLGPMLMRRILDYAASRGIGEIYGDVLHENRPMLDICRALGFRLSTAADDPGIYRVSLRLFPEKGAALPQASTR